MSLDKVKVEVNLKETSQVSKGARGQFFDSLGALLWFEGDALWRIESGETTKKKIAGGGSLWSNVVGAKMPIDQFGFLQRGWFGCEVEAGVYWCVRNEFPTALLEVDTKKGEVEVIFAQTAREAGTGGYFGSGVTRNGPKAVVNNPRGPLHCTIGPNGTQVYFYDYPRLRVADLRTKEVRTLNIAPLGLIHNPELLKPSKPMLLRSDIGSLQNGAQNQTSTGLSWISDSAATFLVDLDTGAYAKLFASKLHPLLALSSSMVLAVEVDFDKAAWIVLVDWSLPSDLASSSTIVKSGYLRPKERIKRISQLPGDFGYGYHRFLFDSTSNQLFCYSDSHQIITRHSNVFKIMSDQDTNHVILPSSMPSSIMSNRDLSKLLHQDCPLTYDLQLTHSASNTSWNIHYNVLKHHEKLKTKEDVDRLATIVKNSRLPSASIFSFLKFLYFSSPAELTNAVESFMPLCHCIQLCNEVGLGTSYSNYILWLLATKIVPHLPNDTLLQNILTLWLVEQDPSYESVATYSKTSPLMSLLASRCRKYATYDEIEETPKKIDLSKAQADSLPRIMGLCTSFGVFLSPGSSLPLTKLELSSSPPYISQQPLKWDENLSVVSRTPPADKYSFVFTIEGESTGGVICNSLYLYPQWRWFERLCQTENCVEVLTRYVVMPECFTPNMILAMLSSCYGTYISSESLTTSEMAILYRLRRELHLPDGRCFVELVENCRDALYSAVNDTNCLEKLYQFWEAGFDLNSSLFVDTVKIVIQNKAKITLDALSKLPARFRLIVSAYLDLDSKATSTDFVAVAAAFELSETKIQHPP